MLLVALIGIAAWPLPAAGEPPAPLTLAVDAPVCGLPLPAGTTISVGDLTRGLERVAVLGGPTIINDVLLPAGTRVGYVMKHMEEFTFDGEPPVSFQETSIQWVEFAAPHEHGEVTFPAGERFPFQNLGSALVFMGFIENVPGDRCWWTNEEVKPPLPASEEPAK